MKKIELEGELKKNLQEEEQKVVSNRRPGKTAPCHSQKIEVR